MFLIFFSGTFFAATAIIMIINYVKKAENVLNLLFSAQMQNGTSYQSFLHCKQFSVYKISKQI
jgi:hypothetical protein